MYRFAGRLVLSVGIALLLVVALPAAGCKSDSPAGDKAEQVGHETADVAEDIGDKAEDMVEETKPVGRKIGEKAEQLGNEAVELGKKAARKGDELIEQGREALKGGSD